jgi:hypothetical protein
VCSSYFVPFAAQRTRTSSLTLASAVPIFSVRRPVAPQTQKQLTMGERYATRFGWARAAGVSAMLALYRHYRCALVSLFLARIELCVMRCLGRCRRFDGV